MRKYLIINILVSLFCLSRGFAQQSSIIHIKYSDEWIAHTGWAETFYDINKDDISDILMRTYSGYGGHLENCFLTIGACECCCYSLYDYTGTGYNNFYMDLSIPLNDDSLRWGSTILKEVRMEGDTVSCKPGLRIKDGENYYYGWLRAFAKYDAENNVFYFKITETCFCTIPNYPLRWGQTSINTDVDENASSAFAAVYPNPSTGIVNIIGQDLKSAEVFNTLGQHVATAAGDGERLSVDLSGQPAGVYFVSVTDKEGRKCVRKVVKE